MLLKGEYVHLLATSGSVFAPPLYIKGKKNGILFISNEITGTMDSQKFQDDLSEFAKGKKSYVCLVY